MRAHRWGTNARMIAEAVVPLGYIEGDVFDATYGVHGGFWTEYRPRDLTTNDLNAPADFHEDFTSFSFDDQAACTVAYDPPYKLNGTPALGDFDNRFGIGQRMTREQKLTPRPQPGDRRQRTARSNYSTLLVFRRGA